MQNSKILTLLAVSVVSLGTLTACSSNSTSTQAKSSAKVDTFTGATAGTTSFDILQKGLTEKGAWINAITANMDAAGKTLTVSGTFKNEKGETARKLALYSQNDQFQITAQYTLSLAKLIINSPKFLLSNGNVTGDVLVNADGFTAQRGKDASGQLVTVTITGNLKFKTQSQLDAYNALPEDQKATVTGTVGLQ